jgi:hypothetical protein
MSSVPRKHLSLTWLTHPTAILKTYSAHFTSTTSASIATFAARRLLQTLSGTTTAGILTFSNNPNPPKRKPFARKPWKVVRSRPSAAMASSRQACLFPKPSRCKARGFFCAPPSLHWVSGSAKRDTTLRKTAGGWSGCGSGGRSTLLRRLSQSAASPLSVDAFLLTRGGASSSPPMAQIFADVFRVSTSVGNLRSLPRLPEFRIATGALPLPEGAEKGSWAAAKLCERPRSPIERTQAPAGPENHGVRTEERSRAPTGAGGRFWRDRWRRSRRSRRSPADRLAIGGPAEPGR